MATIELLPGDTIANSKLVISSIDGDIPLTTQEALELVLALPAAINSLNGMFWTPVAIAKSSNVSKVEYHPETCRLRVAFSSGTYTYHGVPSSVVRDLTKASSSGSFVQKVFVQANVYPFTKDTH